VFIQSIYGDKKDYIKKQVFSTDRSVLLLDKSKENDLLKEIRIEVIEPFIDNPDYRILIDGVSKYSINPLYLKEQNGYFIDYVDINIPKKSKIEIKRIDAISSIGSFIITLELQ